MIYEKIETLCAEKGIKITNFCIEITKSPGNLIAWKKDSFKPDILTKIADYFNISVDYLLGRTDNPEINRSKITKITELKNKSTNAQIAAFSGNDLKAEHTIDEEIATGRRIEKK